MLFREACISTEMAIEAIGRKDYPLANERLIKAQEILMELMGALDLRVEIAQNLHQRSAHFLPGSWKSRTSWSPCSP